MNDESYVYNDQDLLCTDRSLLVVVGVQFLCVTFSISIHGVCYVTLVQFFLFFSVTFSISIHDVCYDTLVQFL